MLTLTDHNDKAGVDYWNEVWKDGSLPNPVDPRIPGWRNSVNRALHQFFNAQFSELRGPETSLLEIGAARSKWLPYFAREFGFSVTGLDYSPTGCKQAREILRRSGVQGNVVEADLFSPPSELQHAFDIVVSFGVVEHFSNTPACVAALAKFLKPGGCMITEIPNLAGLGGKLQRIACPDILALHVVMSERDLEQVHLDAGLCVESCDYFIGAGFFNLNFSCRREKPAYQLISRLPTLLSLPFMAIESTRCSPPPNRLMSPYIICVARASASS
jgi:2-polyprenyl-3-methyl-5-hydroxy-6-metoxy-1,4-benzoquinol methylase